MTPADLEIIKLAKDRGGKSLGVSVPAVVYGDGSIVKGRYVLTIPGWRPALTNELMGNHHRAGRLKKDDVKQVTAACLIFRVPLAKGKRRIGIHIVGRYSTFPDPDAPLKSGLDALKQAGAIVDDSAQWCEWDRPTFARGPKGTVITIEDID